MSIKGQISRCIPQRVKNYRKKVLSTSYPIIKAPGDVFEKVYKVKDATWEDTYYPECYGHCKEQHLQVFDPERYIYYIKNAIVLTCSDTIITDKGVYWGKFNDEEFCTWADPADENVYWYNHESIGIKRLAQKRVINGKTLSLIGLWAAHWGHCMYQFLPKLFTAGEAGLLNTDINVLVVKNEDCTIMEIIRNYLKDFPKAKLIFAEEGTEYKCEELYFMDALGSNFNNHHFRLDYPYYIARHSLNLIKKYVVEPLVEKVKDNETKYEKIFLPRGNYRTLVNYDEVHTFFKSEGFVDLNGAGLTLEQKADYFYHAKEIVGLYGSAYLNLMFCNQAKSMVLINYKMSTDTSLYLQIRDYVSDLVNVTGRDDSTWYHSNYYIPLEKIKKVYKERIASK